MHPLLHIALLFGGLLGLLALFVLIGKMLGMTGGAGGWLRKPCPYHCRPALLSPAELSFYGVLRHVVGGSYSIFTKVRVADVVAVNVTKDRSAWSRAFGKISAKHFDFVLCNPVDLSFVAVLELDDASHQQAKRQERDAFLVELCQGIGLPLIQIPAQRGYTITVIRERLAVAIGPSFLQATGQAVPDEAEPEAQVAMAAPPVPEEPAPVSEWAPPPTCPKCSAPMVRRTAKSGAKAGQEFWGCSSYPRCHATIPIAT